MRPTKTPFPPGNACAAKSVGLNYQLLRKKKSQKDCHFT